MSTTSILRRAITIGISCPECSESSQRQIGSEEIKKGRKVRRRYECINGHRFTTYEGIYNKPSPVVFVPDYQI